MLREHAQQLACCASCALSPAFYARRGALCWFPYSECGMSWIPGAVDWCFWKVKCRILQRTIQIKPRCSWTSSQNRCSSTRTQHRWPSSAPSSSAKSDSYGWLHLTFALQQDLKLDAHDASSVLDPCLSAGVWRHFSQSCLLVDWSPDLAQLSLLIHSS